MVHVITTILSGIALAEAVFLLVSIGILIYYIKSDKPRQDDHDYSDSTKILGGTCNWDEEKQKRER